MIRLKSLDVGRFAKILISAHGRKKNVVKRGVCGKKVVLLCQADDLQKTENKILIDHFPTGAFQGQ